MIRRFPARPLAGVKCRVPCVPRALPITFDTLVAVSANVTFWPGWLLIAYVSVRARPWPPSFAETETGGRPSESVADTIAADPVCGVIVQVPPRSPEIAALVVFVVGSL